MGRKNRQKKQNHSDDFDLSNGFRHLRENFNESMMQQSFSAMATLDRLSLTEQKKTIRQVLQQIGTDIARNDGDPMGNGDQSRISSSNARDKARELYSIGGDIHKHVESMTISEMIQNCLFGNVQGVKHMIQDLNIQQPHSQSIELKKLLETRETSLRLSPLLFLVSGGKNMAVDQHLDHIGVAKVLLKAGACPDAQDVLGKTVCHYGAGVMATDMTLELVDMCIRASRSSMLYGKEVILFGLKAVEMNGKKGIAGGFDPDSERRVVFLVEDNKEVWIKPANIKFEDELEEGEREKKPMLTDVQDRMGTVSLHEVIMQDREDVAKFLLTKHSTSMHTTDMDGLSPMDMVMQNQLMAPKVSKLMHSITRKEAGIARKEAKTKSGVCAGCQVDLGKTGGHRCSACKVTLYCGRECQVSHWKREHKYECSTIKANTSGVKLQPPEGQFKYGVSMSFQSGRKYDQGTYRIPDGIQPHEKFVIKVQGGGDMMPIMVYDESRTCEFTLGPGTPGFKEVLAEIRKEPAWGGRKTFMKASFDDEGNCTVYPSTAGVKAKYSW